MRENEVERAYNNIPFSVVIVTHNRYEKLRNLLDSIDQYAPAALEEVVIVDDSDSKEDINESRYKFPIRHIRLEKRVFISSAKNTGWQSTESGLLFFIDDDNQVGPSTFENTRKILLNDQEIAAVFPSVLYNSARNTVWVYATPFRKGNWGHNLIGRNEERNGELENKIIDIDALPNAFLIKREALEEAGGFSESLPVHNSTFLVHMLKKKGYRVVADTSSFIFHDVEPPLKFGYWASHAVGDPERLYFEIKDWIILNRILHGELKFYAPRAVVRASRFLIPNTLAYMLTGKGVRITLLKNIARGILSGIRSAGNADFIGSMSS